MNEEVKKEDNNKRILMLILGILIVLVAVVGATFAYFVVEVRSPQGKESVILKADAVQGIIYTATEPLVMLHALPGNYAETTFSVNNPNASAVATYSMSLVTDVNEFETTDGTGQLVITISGARLEQDKVIDLTNGNDKSDRLINQNVKLAAGATDTYKIRADFMEIGRAQDTNQGKSFAGHVEVNQSVFVAEE